MPQSARLSNYLKQTQSVMDASDNLLSTLNSKASAEDIQLAIDDLGSAVQKTSPGTIRPLGFSEGGGAIEPLTLEEATSMAAADALMAHVLFAASDAVGESNEPAGPAPLSAALQTAQTQIAQLKGAPAESLGFAEAPSRFHSADVPTATATFRTQAKSALDAILGRSEKGVSAFLKSIADQKDKLLEGLDQVAQIFGDGLKLTGLARQAWQKLRSSMKTIQDIVDKLPLDDVKAKMADILHEVSVRNALERIFGATQLTTEIGGFTLRQAIQEGEIDKQADAVAVLGERYSAVASNIEKVVKVAALVGGIVAAHFAGPFGSLAAPAVFALGIAAVVIVAMDYVGNGFLHSVEGVIQIVRKIEAPAPAAGAR